MKGQKINVTEKETVLKKSKSKLLASVASGLFGAALIAGSLFAVGCSDDSSDKVKYVFNTMGGASISDVEVDLGAEYTLPIPEQREGFLFEGWYTTETFDGFPVTTVEAQANQTYYAKWTQLSQITLELDGGTLAQTKLYLKAGENLYAFMQDYQPTKEGLTFGGWFNGNNALTATTKMPQDGITLTAKYKVSYTVEVYMQDLENSATYSLSEKYTVTGSDFVGKTVVSEKPEVEGCEENATHADRVVTKTLSATSSENVFKYYFDRRVCNVTFVVRYPDGTSGEEITVTKKYGEYIKDAPDTYTAEGYCLIGWGELGAEVPTYEVYAVDKALQNGDGTQRAPQEFTPTGDIVLYSVWAKGYTDMFSGDDYLFFLDKAEDGELDKTTIYLSRGNQFFKGKYFENMNVFFFYDTEDTTKIILNGKLYDNNKFAYTSTKRSQKTAFMYTMGVGTDESIFLKFDETNGITYVNNGDETKGTQQMNEDGEYVADFTGATEGMLKGQKLTFLLGTFNDKPAFIPLNKEEVDYGTLKRFYFNDEEKKLETYANGFGDITLDGYGNATYNNGSQLAPYYYTREGDVITLTSQYGGLFGKAILTENKGVKGYVLYTQWQDREFQIDGAKLVLDGGIKATYTAADGTTVDGYYKAVESLFEGYVIEVDTNDDQKFTFIIKNIQFNDDGTLKDFDVKKVLNSYAEYRYLADGRVYNAAAIVIDETKEGWLSLYGFNSRLNEFVKVSEGPYRKDSTSEKDPYYYYEVENAASGVEGIISLPGHENKVTPADIQSFVFALDSETTAYSLFYWKSSVMTGNVNKEYVEEYTCECDKADCEASLKLVGGFAYYTTQDGVSVSGAYGTFEDATYIVILTSSIAGNVNYYVDLDQDNKTFIPLEYQPYTAYLYDEFGDFSVEEDAVKLIFDGKGNATYVDQNGNPVPGKVRVTDNKTGNVSISEFKADDNSITFNYIGGLSVGGNSAFLLYNESVNGEYEYKKDNVKIGSLTLDGYGYLAKYLDNDGELHEGMYLITEDGAIAVQDAECGKTWYFDINERAFTVRAEEYGEYLWVKNRGWQQETYFELNGYGKLSVYTKTENVDDGTDEVTYTKNYITQVGTYDKIGDMFVLSYKVNEDQDPITLYGELGAFGSSKAFLEKLEDDDPVIGVYVNADDWSVLILDEVGNAIKYVGKEDKTLDYGQKQVGYYTLITEDLLYFVNASNTDACLYEYDSEHKTATQVKSLDVYTRYFSQDMELLTFYQYGYFTITEQDGTTERYFYREKYEMDNGVQTVVGLTMYESNPDDKDASPYGFVSTELPNGYGDMFEFQDKTFYKNDNEIVFINRDTTDVYEADKLTYALNGQDFGMLDFDIPETLEFEETGRIVVGGAESSCRVVREKDENEQLITYVEFQNYRIYVEFDYQGVDKSNTTKSTYKITGMEFHQQSYARNYLDNYAYYAGFGYKIDNTLGEITIHGTYNADGSAENVVVDATFLENSSVKDMNGNLIVFENAEYIDHGVNASYGQHYEAVFTAEDGQTYSLHFIVSQHTSVRAYAFNVLALTRHQDFTGLENGYAIETERVMYSEYSTYEKGDLFDVKLLKDGSEIEGELVTRRNNIIQVIDGSVIFVAREKDQTDKYTSATYYMVELISDPLIENTDGSVEIPFYTSGKVAGTQMVDSILYANNNKYFVEFIGGNPTLLCMANETFVVKTAKTLSQAEIEALDATYLPTDGSTIKAAYEITSPTSVNKYMVQIREIEVDGVTTTYVSVAEMFQ